MDLKHYVSVQTTHLKNSYSTKPHDKFKAVRTCYITPKLVQLLQPKAPNCAARLSWEQIICDKCAHTHKGAIVSFIHL